MKFYVHAGSEEPTGTEGRYIWKDLKTRGGAIRRARRIFKGKPFTLIYFTDLYDESTHQCILRGAAWSGDAPKPAKTPSMLYSGLPTFP